MPATHFNSFRLFTYVLKRVSVLFLFMTSSILFLIWLAQSIYAIELMGGGRLSGLWDVIHLMTLIIPVQLSVLAPISLAVASGWTLYLFLNDNELVAFQALGWSRGSVIAPLLALSVAVMLLVYSMVFYFAPMCARIESSKMKNAGLSAFLSNIGSGLERTFFHPNDSISIYIQKIDGNELKGVFISERQDNTDRIYTAQEGTISNEAQNRSFLVLRSGTIQVIQDGKEANAPIISFEKFQYEFSPEQTSEIKQLTMNERFFGDLYHPKDLYAQSIKPRLRTELHDRISTTLWCPALLLMSVLTIFSLPLSRRSPSAEKRVALGVICIVILRIGCSLLYELSVHVPIFIVVMYATPLLITTFGLYYFYGKRWRS